MSTADRKKKNFSFSRKFPFMKSKDQIGSDEQLSTEERKSYPRHSEILHVVFDDVQSALSNWIQKIRRIFCSWW